MAGWKATASSDDQLSSNIDEAPEEQREYGELEYSEKTNVSIRDNQCVPNKSAIDPFGTPPDGGLNAWLKVLGCFLLYSNIWYIVSTSS